MPKPRASQQSYNRFSIYIFEMSDDVIGWETLKIMDFRKKLDFMLADQETVEASAQEIKSRLEAMEEGFSKEMILKSLDSIMGFFELQRVQIIWINALREGLMQIEKRLDDAKH